MNRDFPRPLRRARSEPEGVAREHLGYLLKQLHHSLRQNMDEALRHRNVGLSFAHVVALFCVSEEPGVSGAHIAKRAMVTAQTINAILQRMEREGSLERRQHSSYRRVDCWYLTDLGRAQLRRARAAAKPVWKKMLAPFSGGELHQLQDFLKRCIEGLERTPLRRNGAKAGGKIPAGKRSSRPKAVRSK